MGNIEFECPHCGQRMEGQEELMGETITCPSCGHPMAIGGMGKQMSSVPFSPAARLKEYKVLQQKPRGFDPFKLEATLNTHALQGWRVVSTVWATFPDILTDIRVGIIVILERDR